MNVCSVEQSRIKIQNWFCFIKFDFISVSNNSADDEERWECFGCRRYSWSNAGAGSAVGKEHIKQVYVRHKYG